MLANTVIAERFVALRPAGSGGMGAIFYGTDRRTERAVAVKVLADGAVDRERFLREAHLLSQLEHPAIVRYVAHGETEGGEPYLVMEWLEGRDLSARLAEQPLGMAAGLELARRVADALGAAHRAGIVHRDLKPSNVFLPGDNLGRATLIDFGIARGLGRGSAVTATGFLVGTPGYMAPEQARGSREIDGRADVFAVGCLLYECITGRPPFAGDTSVAMLAKVLLDERPRLADVLPDAPPELDALLARLLARDPADRPRDGEAAAEELGALMERLGGQQMELATPTLTRAERRLGCVILVAPPGVLRDRAEADAATEVMSGAETAIASSDESPSAIYGRVTALTRALRARVEVIPGGVILVVPGGDGSLTEHVVRGARCALALRGVSGGALVALSTGRASSAPGSPGEALDRAFARLRAAVGEGSSGDHVLVDDVAAGLLASTFELRRTPSGFVLRGAAAEAGAHTLLGKETPCVGRDRELGMLGLLVDECLDEPVARVALLLGPAGVGKSRVRHELELRLAAREPAPAVWSARGDVVSAGSPYGLLRSLLSTGLGLPTGPAEQRAEAFVARIEARVGADRAGRVAAFLGALLGLAVGAGAELAAAAEDPLLMGDQTRRALLELLSAECAAQPVVWVLEDLHWGDWPSLRLVDAALGALSDRPFFVLASARPEVEDLFPRLFAEHNPQEIRLPPLTRKAVERLVRHVLGERASAEVVARVVAGAAGHPLQVEELVRLAADGQDFAPAGTLLAMIDARIEAMDPAVRRVLRAAAVLGRTFSRGGLVALLGPEIRAELGRCLDELVRREWIAEQLAPRLAGESEYSFRQDLLQEAAYARLTEGDLRMGHRLAGAFLEAAGESDAMALARHFDLGKDGARAAVFFARAAEQALDGGDFAAAVERAAKAAALTSEARVRGRALSLQADAHLHRGELPLVCERARAALVAAEPASADACRAARVLAVASARSGDRAGLEAVAEALIAASDAQPPRLPYVAAAAAAAVQLAVVGALPAADRVLACIAPRLTGDDVEPAARGHYHHACGARAAMGGDVGTNIAELREAVRAFDAAGDLRAACSSRKTLGWYAGECGAFEEGERLLREAIVAAEQLGLPNLAAHARQDLASPLLRLGKLDEAEAEERAALAVVVAQGDLRLASICRAMLAWIARERGEIEASEREAREALALAPSETARLTALAQLATTELVAGREAEALASAEEGLRILDTLGAAEEGTTQLFLTAARAADALGQHERAVALVTRARGDVLERADRLRDGALRSAFLTRIGENAETLALFEAWGGAE